MPPRKIVFPRQRVSLAINKIYAHHSKMLSIYYGLMSDLFIWCCNTSPLDPVTKPVHFVSQGHPTTVPPKYTDKTFWDIQRNLRSVDWMHSKRRYRICTCCSVILGNLSLSEITKASTTTTTTTTIISSTLLSKSTNARSKYERALNLLLR